VSEKLACEECDTRSEAGGRDAADAKERTALLVGTIGVKSIGPVAQMVFIVVAALRAVVKALWRVGDCEAWGVASSAKAVLAAAAGHFRKEFGASPACHRPPATLR
jgi:hypothetical protein